MNEIKCPNCGKIFQISKRDYDSILTQIKDKEFQKELERIEREKSKEKESALEISKINFEKLQSTLEKDYFEKLSEKEREILDLQSKIKLQEKENALQIQREVSSKEQEIATLKNEIELNKNKFELKEQSLKESYEADVKSKEELIAYYKDFKARQSTKMIGESLEIHCQNEFNSLRPLFKNAYFEKDNDVKTGSKGDFIFRDYEDGIEFVSIMFEMKNEGDETASKHKNEDFLKELDKDRREKNCEYAVLVTLLEIDNELYNNGIVDMSYKYEKMYVIRPQFFIPLITLIRNLALNSLSYKKELQHVKNQNIDIAHFEENIEAFKEGFGKNYRLASERFKKAIDEIDKTIDHLQKTKDALLSSENNLRLANKKAEDLTIKKLTQNSETIAKMFEEQKTKKKEVVS